jgi:hypothetical protein
MRAPFRVQILPAQYIALKMKWQSIRVAPNATGREINRFPALRMRSALL